MGVTRSRRADSKIPQLVGHLRELAVQKGPNARLPSIVELCELFNTSRATIHETLDALEEQHVIYRKTGSGIFVSPKIFRTNFAILYRASHLSSAGTSPFWGMLLSYLAEVAQERASNRNEYSSLHMVIRTPDQEVELPEDVIQAIRKGNIAGVLGVGLNYLTTKWIKEQGIPCIGFASILPTAVVAMNYALLIEWAVQHLHAQGCRSIGLWLSSHCLRNVQPHVHNIEQFLVEDYFHMLLDKHQLSYQPHLIHRYESNESQMAHKFAQHQGYDLAYQVFSDPLSPRPDGLIITNDQMTEGALSAFEALGVHTGEHLHLITHGNAGASVLLDYHQNVAVLEFDALTIAQEMFSLLDAYRENPSYATQMVLLPPRFRKRSQEDRKGV